MYSCVTDRNTKVVYEWVKTTETGEQRVTIFQPNWKTKEEWTQEEIESLFDTEIQELFDEIINDKEPAKKYF